MTELNLQFRTVQLDDAAQCIGCLHKRNAVVHVHRVWLRPVQPRMPRAGRPRLASVGRSLHTDVCLDCSTVLREALERQAFRKGPRAAHRQVQPQEGERGSCTACDEATRIVVWLVATRHGQHTATAWCERCTRSIGTLCAAA